MAKRYASMPCWLFRLLMITDAMDSIAFRQHDHDYGGKGLQAKYADGSRLRVSDTRWDADYMLRIRLIAMGLAPWNAWLIWLGCRVLLWRAWRR